MLGIDGNEVYTVPVGRVAAVVSGLTSSKIRPQRANLAFGTGILGFRRQDVWPRRLRAGPDCSTGGSAAGLRQLPGVRDQAGLGRRPIDEHCLADQLLQGCHGRLVLRERPAELLAAAAIRHT